MGIPNDLADPRVPADTATILANIVWVIDRLDGVGLRELDDVPVLELAKHIVVGRRAAA